MTEVSLANILPSHTSSTESSLQRRIELAFLISLRLCFSVPEQMASVYQGQKAQKLQLSHWFKGSSWHFRNVETEQNRLDELTVSTQYIAFQRPQHELLFSILWPTHIMRRYCWNISRSCLTVDSDSASCQLFWRQLNKWFCFKQDIPAHAYTTMMITFGYHLRSHIYKWPKLLADRLKLWQLRVTHATE